MIGDIFALDDVIAMCESGALVDDDGYGEPISMQPEGEHCGIGPSTILAVRAELQARYKYFIWYNR